MASRPRGSAFVRVIVVLSVIAAALAWVTPALAAGGSITASRSDSLSLKRAFNLTTQGPIDWAVWGYSNGGTSTSLAPDVRKAGGNAISNLENISPASPTVPLRGLGQFPDVNAFKFSWSNGSSPLRDSLAAAGIQHDGQQTGSSTSGDGFGFTVPAGLQPRTVKVYVATNRANGMLTAHLSDGSAPDYTDVLPAAVDQNTTVYTITYQAGSTGQTLHVTWVESLDTCGSPFHCDNAGIYAVALTRNFVVNNAGAPVDAGCTVSDCTLPEAVADANADAGGSISFSLGAAPAPINLAAALTITKPASIDGYTQSGASANTSAFQDGNNAVVPIKLGTGAFDIEGLVFGPGSDGSSVRGLAINQFSNAIHVQGASDVTIAGNFIGTQGSFPSNGTGVFVDGGAGSTVGGPESADQNVISNNGGFIGTGIDLNGATGTLIQGNYVGTDATGNVALANDDGIAIFGGAKNNVVSGNVISGNFNDGVTLYDDGTAGNSVVLNLIGIGADGSTPLHNSTGVSITPGANGNANAIGGPLGGNRIANNSDDGVDVDGAGSQTVVQGNTITGNQGHGIVIGDELGGAPGVAITGNRIAGNGHAGFDGFGIYVFSVPGPVTITGNTIGLDASGAAAQPNTSDGIRIDQSSNVVVGGPGAGDRNVVSGNLGHGIHLMRGSTGNTIQGNYLGTNTGRNRCGSQPDRRHRDRGVEREQDHRQPGLGEPQPGHLDLPAAEHGPERRRQLRLREHGRSQRSRNGCGAERRHRDPHEQRQRQRRGRHRRRSGEPGRRQRRRRCGRLERAGHRDGELDPGEQRPRQRRSRHRPREQRRDAERPRRRRHRAEQPPELPDAHRRLDQRQLDRDHRHALDRRRPLRRRLLRQPGM